MAEETTPTAPAPRKRLPLLPMIVTSVALVEAVAFFAVYKYMGGGPTPARAAGSHADGTPVASEPPEKSARADQPAAKEPPSKEPDVKEGPTPESGPPADHGGPAKGVSPEATPASGLAEVVVLKNFKVPNNKTGRLFIYDMDISVVVASAEKERMEKLVKQRTAELGDGIALLIRRSNEHTLGEDDLRTLRAQLKEVLVEILSENRLIQRVLIPRFVPIRAD